MTPLKIISIVLKPLQIVLLVIGMGFVAYFTKEYHDFLKVSQFDAYDAGYFGRNEFFLYSTGIGVVFAAFELVCVLMGQLENKHSALAVSAEQAICTCQLLVSTALLAKVLTTFQKKEVLSSNFLFKIRSPSLCEKWDKNKFHHTCDDLMAGVICGFLAVVAFAVDTAISFVSYKQAQ